MSNEIQSLGSNPTGIKGKFTGILMNIIHGNQYKKIIKKYILNRVNSRDELKILDIGCGGGKAVNIFSILFMNSKVYGIDHSADMVALSGKVNKKGIEEGNVEITQGDIISLPYSDRYFDMITAFDTINFWNDFNKAISEIIRVLKKGGAFIIVNAYPKEGTKWWDFVKFKNDSEYREALAKHNFTDINITIEKTL